jgi:tetratricopeptide (TPR) repeat protein
MRAPFADMMLLWYETVAKQLFNLSEADVSLGTNQDIEQIINKNLQKYPRSSLFLYYKGRYYRSCVRNLDLAHDCFKQAFDFATHARELQLIAVYELGWLHLMNLKYEDALACFKRLSEESKWSTSFHKYVCALLNGCLNRIKEANQCVKDGIGSLKHKNNPIEQFATKRLEYLKSNPIKSSEICEFMCVELNFLWVCVPYCERTKLEKMLQSNFY